MSNSSTEPLDKWAIFGFTTTPEERIGPPPPYSFSALQINLCCRLLLGIFSLFVTWVPARLLWRNGEFAGAMLCGTLMVLNFKTVVNALIWRDDNVADWYAGYGWCDLQAYLIFSLHSAFNISLFEIMRGLASKVALKRVLAPTRRERHRQRIVSALIIFTFPVIQVALTYFVIIGRYNVSTLVGCQGVYLPTWVYLVFYIIPTPVFAVAAAYMGVVTFIRYRRIEKVTSIISSEDDIAAARQARVRKKLYFITVVVILVALPLVSALMIYYILVARDAWPKPYNFNATHFGPDPFNIYFISFTTSDMMNWQDLSTDYIGLLAGIFLFVPFGTTAEALNMYRKILLSIGLGYIFPKLKNVYHPILKRRSKSRWWSSVARSVRGKSLLTSSTSAGSTQKDSLLPTVSLSSASPVQTREYPTPATEIPKHPETIAMTPAHHNPWPDLSATEIDITTAQIQASTTPIPPRNPFIFHTALASTPIAPFNNSINNRSSNRNRNRDRDRDRDTSPSPFHSTPPSRKESPAPPPGSHIPLETSSPWSDTPVDRPKKIGVDTRVWAAAASGENGNGNGSSSGSGSNSVTSSNNRRRGVMGMGDSDVEVGRMRDGGGYGGGVMVETRIARSSEIEGGVGGGGMHHGPPRSSSAAS